MRLARARSADQHDIALVGEESAGGEIADQRLVDRGAGELEVRDLLGERRLGDRHLILDRAGMLVGDLGLQQRSEEHTSELQSLMRISYAVFCLKKKKHTIKTLKCYINETEQIRHISLMNIQCYETRRIE